MTRLPAQVLRMRCFPCGIVFSYGFHFPLNVPRILSKPALESIPDLAWGILLKKGIQDRYETYLSDAMPKPKKQYLFPVFDQETWDAMIQAILEAVEIWKSAVIKLAQEPEPGPAIKKSDFEQWNPR